MKKMSRWLGGLLAVLLLAGTCAYAQAAPGVVQGSVTVRSAAQSGGMESDELLEGYLYQAAGMTPRVSAAAASARPALYAVPMQPLTAEVYSGLLPEIREIAAGTRASTQIQVPVSIAYTKEELGVTGTLVADGAITSEANAKISARFRQDLAVDTLLNQLLLRNPYELYWFDKTVGISAGCGISCTGEVCTIVQVTVSMPAAAAYQGGSELTVDTAKTGAASAAAQTAAAVAAGQQGSSDYEKLRAYLTYITGEVSYNSGALAAGTAYGDPWQVIYVFDGDSSTNVVCEGYAKAFKYLCDLTWRSGDPAVQCLLATGTMDGGTGAGGHMWNIVTIGGRNYLADVTNCDTGTAGAPDLLFLCGVRGSAAQSYTAAAGGREIRYVYDDHTRSVYDTELELSDTAYDPDAMTPMELLTALTRYVACITDVCPAGADVNGDGQVDADDMTALARTITG